MRDEGIFLTAAPIPVSSGGTAWRRFRRSTGVTTPEMQKPRGCGDPGLLTVIHRPKGERADSLDVVTDPQSSCRERSGAPPSRAAGWPGARCAGPATQSHPQGEREGDARDRPGQRPFGGQRRLPSRDVQPAHPRTLPASSTPGTNGVVPLDEEKFQSLLEQVRELHRLADEATRERARFDAYVQARLRWDDRTAPALPAAQRDLADQAVDALSRPRLSTLQSRQVYRAFFGKSSR